MFQVPSFKSVPTVSEICKVIVTANAGNLVISRVILHTDIVKQKMEGILGNIEVELDGRFKSIRTQETNLGNDSYKRLLINPFNDSTLLSTRKIVSL